MALPARPVLLDRLFRETDRVQRSREPLSLVLFEIDDIEHWQSRMGRPRRDALLVGVVDRVGRMLRSYDFFGRTGDHQFLLILPGCSTINANLLADRLRSEVPRRPSSIIMRFSSPLVSALPPARVGQRWS
jgi:diguanylate cyclase (GGDEF)-like protein